MSAKEIYADLEGKILTIQQQAILLDTMFFSEIGKELHKKFNQNPLAHTHKSLENALITALNLEIAKLFDDRSDTKSLYHCLEELEKDQEKSESYKKLKKQYDCMKGSHHLKIIIDYRNKNVAHNSTSKVNGYSLENIDYLRKNLMVLFADLFTVFHPECGISNDISDSVFANSKLYLKCLMYGFENMNKNPT